MITDPLEHSMGSSLVPYVQSRVHEVLDEREFRRIVVIGGYHRDLRVSHKEKKDKRENWQRPTAEIVGDELRIHCFPGRAHVFHHGSLVATHLALTGRDPRVVELVLPSPESCAAEVAGTGLADAKVTPIAIVASGNDLLAPVNASWLDQGAFETRQEKIGEHWTTWFAIKHSFWGDIAYHVGKALADAGFELVLFVGKLGSLVTEHEPNVTIATGNTSVLDDTTISWDGPFAGESGIVEGRHITLPSVLQETTVWRDEHVGAFAFVDPEIGNMGAGAAAGGAAFGYLHLVSDNLAKKYPEDLSDERRSELRARREATYARIGAMLRTVLAGSF